MNHETCTYRSLSDRPGWCIHEWNVASKMPLPVSVAFPLQAIQYFNNYPIWWLKAGVHLDQTSFGTGRFRRWGVWAVGSSFSEEQVGSQGCRGCLILCKCLSNLEMGINGLWARYGHFHEQMMIHQWPGGTCFSQRRFSDCRFDIIAKSFGGGVSGQAGSGLRSNGLSK
jgi:hypothetical protein